MTNTEKVAYIRGLAEGLELDDSKKEVKVLNAIIDLLDDLAMSLADLEDGYSDMADQLDAVDEDLGSLEDDFYGDDEDDEEDDEEEECFVTTCPECEEEVYFDETVLEDGEVVCPNCGAKLEFDLSDLAAAAEDGEDEE